MASSSKPTPPPPSPAGSRSTTGRRRDQLANAGEDAMPRVPAERDESSDSHHDRVRGVIKQAHDDVVSGQQDTDRKPAMDRAYEAQKGAGAPGTAPAAPDMSGAGEQGSGTHKRG